MTIEIEKIMKESENNFKKLHLVCVNETKKLGKASFIHHGQRCEALGKLEGIKIGFALGHKKALEDIEKEIDNLKRKNPKGVPWISAPELKQRLEKLRGAGK